jgi:pimeloyl-ACP methyl ester carboxylesterase
MPLAETGPSVTGPAAAIDAGRGPIDRILDRATDALLLRPWLDGAALRMVTRWYFPLSRAWATALDVDGDVDAFLDRLDRGPTMTRLLPRALAATVRRQQVLREAEQRWEEAFFGPGPALAAAEAARIAAAQALMATRSAFLPVHSIEPFPAIAWDIEEPEAVRRRHQARLLPALAFPEPPGPAVVEASRGFPAGRGGVDGWIRFPSPGEAVGGQAWARVSAPVHASVRGTPRRLPSVIFCHGIGMEPEYWKRQRFAPDRFLDAGIRVIRAEAPWHGRRRIAGGYGGEPILGRGPGGLIDFFHAAVRELGTMIAWARATRGGPVALAGVSLGALTAQLVATASRAWPKSMRPDILFLIAPSLSLTRVTYEGRLTQALGVPEAMRLAGWTPDAVLSWRSLLEPVGEPAVDPAHVLVVLGETDDVTLTEGGEDLVAAWGVPEANVFRFPAGHFTTSLALMRDGGPARRLRALLAHLGS